MLQLQCGRGFSAAEGPPAPHAAARPCLTSMWPRLLSRGRGVLINRVTQTAAFAVGIVLSIMRRVSIVVVIPLVNFRQAGCLAIRHRTLLSPGRVRLRKLTVALWPGPQLARCRVHNHRV